MLFINSIYPADVKPPIATAATFQTYATSAPLALTHAPHPFNLETQLPNMTLQSPNKIKLWNQAFFLILLMLRMFCKHRHHHDRSDVANDKSLTYNGLRLPHFSSYKAIRLMRTSLSALILPFRLNPKEQYYRVLRTRRYG